MADLFSLLMARATGQAVLLRARPRGIFEDGTAPLPDSATMPDEPAAVDAAGQAPDRAEPAARHPARAAPVPNPTPGPPANLADAPPTPIRLDPGRATIPILARRSAPAGPLPSAAVQAPRAPTTIPPAPSPVPAPVLPHILAPVLAPTHPPPASPTASRPGDPAAPPAFSAVATANDAPDHPEPPRAAPSRLVQPMQAAAPLPPVSRRDGVAKAAPPPPPDIRIEIGRIEVRAPAAPAAPSPRASGLMSLDRYLRRDPPR